MFLAHSSRRRIVAALFALTALLETSRAHAYCREVTLSPPPGYNPVDAGCFTANPDGGSELPPLFWRNQCVGFSMQQNASTQVSLADAENVAFSAFNAWSSITCPGGGSPSITASELPPVECDSVPSQLHNNVIMFRDDVWPYDDSANAIGFTTLTVCIQPPCPGDPNALPGEILGADTEINSALYRIIASGTPPSGAYDLASILTHEAGHFLGLAHTADETAVMYAFYHPESTVPQPDDVAGICAIYPPDGSRSTEIGSVAATSCNPEPLLGLEEECGSVDAGLNGGDDDAGTSDSPTSNGDTLFGCAIGQGSHFGTGGLVMLGTIALGAWIRTRRGSRRLRSISSKIGVWVALLSGGALQLHPASASVSVIVTFDDLVRRATAVAVVTPLEPHALWENGRIVTYTRAHVDRQIAGKLEEEVWIRTLGGDVGNIGNRVEGQATFALGHPSLVFLHPHLDPVVGGPSGTFGVVEAAQGQFPIVLGNSGRATLTTGQNVGALALPRGSGIVAARFARDVLRDRPLEDAAREIAAAWTHAH